MFRSSRARRIDRALSNVLSAIDDRFEAMPANTWRELEDRALAADCAMLAAHDRAAKLHAKWLAIVEKCED